MGEVSTQKHFLEREHLCTLSKELKMETSTQLTCEGEKGQQFMAGASLGLGVLAKPLTPYVPQFPSCKMGCLFHLPSFRDPTQNQTLLGLHRQGAGADEWL